MTRTRHRALDAHLARLSGPPARARPGSYAWPELRREAECRFAAGEPPARVIGDLRGAVAAGPARAPSRRAMMRWFREGFKSGSLDGAKQLFQLQYEEL